MSQICINFDASEFEGFATLREYMQECVIKHCAASKKLQKTIAADMDLAPSCLTRKLAGADGDKRSLTVGDLERYVETQRDMKPILYLVDKYLAEGTDDDIEELERQLAAKKAARARRKP
jgi:hypothetical protein